MTELIELQNELKLLTERFTNAKQEYNTTKDAINKVKTKILTLETKAKMESFAKDNLTYICAGQLKIGNIIMLNNSKYRICEIRRAPGGKYSKSKRMITATHCLTHDKITHIYLETDLIQIV